MSSDLAMPWPKGPVVKYGKDFVGGLDYLVLALKTNKDYNGDEEQLLQQAWSLQTLEGKEHPCAELNSSCTLKIYLLSLIIIFRLQIFIPVK
jgi:hypothetical protein